MLENWTNEELRAVTRAYLWMLRSSEEGNHPKIKLVTDALLAGPLSVRTESSVLHRFGALSAIMLKLGRAPLPGTFPGSDSPPSSERRLTRCITEYKGGPKHLKRVNFLVAALPLETVKAAAESLGGFAYASSTTYDVVLSDGRTLAPKSVVAHAAQLHYGAPLLPEDFSGGEGTTAFERLRAAGLIVAPKAPTETKPESPQFRAEVKKQKKKGFAAPPVGNKQPKKVATTSTTFVRDPAVVAFVEQRAKGHCEHCGKPAPFLRIEGTPFLEVHHIDPLSEDGPDTVENAAALCPNCHRECHHGQKAKSMRGTLREKFLKEPR